jgi:hypothetical protein
MSRRYKSRTMKFGVPLSLPGSRYIEHCYAAPGKGYDGTPPSNSAIELVLVNAQRELWRVEGRYPEPHKYLTDATTHDSGWRILGWRMADGSVPFGDYDAVDPDLAQFDYLPAPNAPEMRSHSIPHDASGVEHQTASSDP